MSYLHINGIAVPVKECQPGYVPIAGNSGYSPNGVYQVNRNGFARQWKVRTSLLSSDMRVALAEMLSHRGEAWRWELSSAANGVHYIPDETASEAYSDRIRLPKSASNATVMSAYGADGARVYDWNGNPYAPLSGCEGSLLVEEGATNIATANLFDPANTTGFGTYGSSTRSHDTEHYWTGDGSIDVALDGLGGSEGVTIGAITGQTDYIISAFVRVDPALAGATIRAQIWDDTASVWLDSARDTVATYADGWYRVYATGAPAGGASSDVYLRIWVPSNGTAASFFVDGVMAEVQPSLLKPTAPVDPGSDPFGAGTGVRPAGVLDWANTFVASYTQGITLAAWVNIQNLGVSAVSAVLIDSADDFPKIVLFWEDGSGDRFALEVASDGGTYLQPRGTQGKTVGWYHVVGVYDRKTNAAYLYVNGALESSDTSWSGGKGRTFMDASGMTGDFSLGTFGAAGANVLPGPLGPCMVLPFAAPAEMVSGWYNGGADSYAVPGVFPLGIHGDVLGTSELNIKALATIDSMPHIEWEKDGVWQGHGGEIAFTLTEATAR